MAGEGLSSYVTPAPLPLPDIWDIRRIHGIIDPERDHSEDPW